MTESGVAPLVPDTSHAAGASEACADAWRKTDGADVAILRNGVGAGLGTKQKKPPIPWASGGVYPAGAGGWLMR